MSITDTKSKSKDISVVSVIAYIDALIMFEPSITGMKDLLDSPMKSIPGK
jgi:hypothetical protein